MNIVVLEQPATPAEAIAAPLAAAGYALAVFPGAPALLAELRQETPALLVLDWQLADAPEVLAWARKQLAPELPVLLVCLLGEAASLDAGLAAGASDYQLRPLRRGELLARVAGLLRRAWPVPPAAEPLQFDTFAFDLQQHRVTRAGVGIALTRKEFALALLFFRHLGRPLSRATIQEAVWAQEPELPTRTMDTHVSRVRNKLGLRPDAGYRLAPVYSYGYQLERSGTP